MPSEPRLEGHTSALRVLVVDDEPLARARLRMMLEEWQASGASWSLELFEAADGRQALQRLAETPIDVLLLDIGMPGLSGLDLARALRPRVGRPQVVFISAHRDQAFQAFEVEAVDFIGKPVARERLREAVGRALARRATEGGIGPVLTTASPHTESLVVAERGKLHLVRVADVLYLRADHKYVALRTAQSTYLLDYSLSDLEVRLGDAVMRVHRNALVARSAVTSLAWVGSPAHPGWALCVAPVQEWVDVSRRHLAEVRRFVKGSP